MFKSQRRLSKLRAGQPRHASITGRVKIFFSFPERADLSWCSRSLEFDGWRCLPPWE